MLRKIKRILSLILIITLVSSNISISVKAEKTTKDVETDTEVTVEATDSLGTLLTQSIDEEISRQQENNGYNIFAVEISGRQALVEFETNKDAVLVIGIYDEAGKQMLASGYANISADNTNITVEIETESMPEYFYLRGFIVDGETYRPVCPAYESPMYTKEMQEFLSKTTDDFSDREVLNFDNDKTTNFAVYNEETIVIESAEDSNLVVKADTENETYIFENADETITSLMTDDILTYEYEDGTILIIKVSEITINGTTATIIGKETSMEEVFEYIKIEADADTEDALVDDSVCDEGVTYNGIVETDRDEIQSRAISGEASISKAISLSVGKEFENGSTVQGSLELEVDNYVNFYFSTNYQYLEVRMDYEAGLSISFSGKIEGTLVLVKIIYNVLPGVLIEITPLLDFEVSAEFSLSGTLEGTAGFKVTSEEGMKIIASTPQFKTEIKGEITVFIGLPLKPSISLINEKVAKVELGAKVGVEITGKSGLYFSKGSVIHECRKCIEGEINGIIEISAGASILNLDGLTWEASKNWKMKIADFYCSLTFGDYGFTTCPHMAYKITVTTKDNNKVPVKGAVINDTYETDSEGRAVFYLPSGKNSIIAEKSGMSSIRKNIIVDDAPMSIVLYFDGQDITGENEQIYKHILDRYDTALNEGWDNQEGINYLCRYNDPTEVGYTYIDVDKNGVKELLIGEINSTGNYVGMFYDLYTIVNNESVLLASSMERDRFYLCEDYTIANEGSSSAYVSVFNFYHIGGDGDSLSVVESVLYDAYRDSDNPWFYNTNGLTEEGYISITEQQAEQIKNKYMYMEIPFIPFSEYPRYENTVSNVSMSNMSESKGAAVKTIFFENLIPGETYNFYSMNYKDVDTPFVSDNLFYINQYQTNAAGGLQITYTPTVDEENTNNFVVCMGGLDISDAKIMISDKMYTGKEIFINPTVTYEGKVLTEGVDYELSGQYSATEVGTYTVVITGTGDYTGTIFKTYQIHRQIFKDVRDTEYYYMPVMWAVNNGITTGYSETIFAPYFTCTRGQIVTFLWRANGCPESKTTENPFSDVSPDEFYYKAVLWAYENKITTGITNTSFAPDAGCTRGQVTTFLWRTNHCPVPKTMKNPFSDVSANEFYYIAVLWAFENGITTGLTATEFAPENSCQRAQIVTFLYREAMLPKPESYL